MGITLATYRAAVQAHATCADLRAMPRPTAERIYRERYWDAIKGDSLPPGIDLMVFDHGVNAGTGRAVKMLQRLLGVSEDGQVGPLTHAAVWDTDVEILIDRYLQARLSYYQSLPGFARYGKGWNARAESVYHAALDQYFAHEDEILDDSTPLPPAPPAQEMPTTPPAKSEAGPMMTWNIYSGARAVGSVSLLASIIPSIGLAAVEVRP
jgi:lysozyme family protein